MNEFGAVLIQLLEERDMDVPDLVEELGIQKLVDLPEHTAWDVATIMTTRDPEAELYVRFTVACKDVLDLHDEEYNRLWRAAHADARARLARNRKRRRGNL